MKIILGNVYSHVEYDNTNEEYGWLKALLTFPVKGKTNQTEPLCLLRIDNSFLAGLTKRVYLEAQKAGVPVQIVDKRIVPPKPLPWAKALNKREQWLRDYQIDAVDKALAKTRGILNMVTGSGKTEVAIGIALRIEGNTLFIAPEKDLAHNAARRWTLRTGMEAGMMGDGILAPQDGFTAATFQTLASVLKRGDDDTDALRDYLATVDCIIIDECHTIPAESFLRVLCSIPNAYYRIGMSGTPLSRGDRRSVLAIAATGAVIKEIKPAELIEQGIISKPIIEMHQIHQVDGCPVWQQSYKNIIVTSEKRNNYIAKLARLAKKPALVFVREKAHGERLTAMLRGMGIRVDFVWGELATKRRDDSIKRLVDGDLDVIVCSVVFQTGTDIPEVVSLIIACGGKSEIAALQRIGRGMRMVVDKTTGEVLKDKFYVYDVYDDTRGSRSGWHTKHSNDRLASYRKAGHDVTIVNGNIGAPSRAPA